MTSHMQERELRKCQKCGELDMILRGSLNCDGCEEKIKSKNKSLLEV